jgi:hypothetical protein
MIRIVILQTDNGAAIGVGAPVVETYHTFEIEAQKIETFLREQPRSMSRVVVGAEVIDDEEQTPEPGQ